MINIDTDIEKEKQQLALKSDFNLPDAYRMFDKDNKGYIFKTEFE